MPRPLLRSFLMGCLSLGLFAAGLSCAQPASEPRHVILISLDTLRADHLGCYGSDVRTPHLDALASEGVVFEDVTSAAPTTLASHVSLMTGVSPRVHGIPRNGFEIHPDNTLLAERLAAAGFRTAGFLGSFALDHHFGFHRGFEHFDRDFDLLLDGAAYDQNQRRAETVTDAVLHYLDGAPDERHFLFVHYFDAHNPFDPPAPFNRMYGRQDGPVSADLTDLENTVGLHHVSLGMPARRTLSMFQNGLTPELAEAHGAPQQRDHDMAALYAGEVSYLDQHLGRLFEGLRERGLYDDALIVVTADHGESFWEHGDFWNHGLWVFETTVRVPLIVRQPGERGAGQRVSEPVSTLDVVPTILEAIGPAHAAAASGPALEGRSLVPALRGDELGEQPLFAEATQPVGEVERGQPWLNQQKPRAVRLGRWKYVHAPYLDHEQLFDLDVDPGERNNLLRAPTAELRAVRDRLRAELDEWSASPLPLPSSFSTGMNDEVVERLRQLGYHEGPPPEQR